MNCNCCFHDFIAKCNESLRVYAQLDPLTDYIWVIKDKFGNLYQGEFLTDADGFWSILVEELPAGLLTQYSGDFTLQVQSSGCRPVKFKIAQEYDCIAFTIKGGTYEKNTLGCNFNCTPAVGTQTSMEQFENDTTVTIEWTSAMLTAFGNSPTVQVYHETSPNVFQLVDVEVSQVFSGEVLQSIEVNNGGPATGYILIS